MSVEISYYDDDDPYADESRDDQREQAYNLWRKNGDRCNSATLRLANEFAQDNDSPADQRAIYRILKKRGRL